MTQSSIPPVLLPYQQRWVADESQVKVWSKSRRIGASWCEAADAVLIASAQSGSHVLYTGYNKEMALTFLSDCAAWSEHFELVASEVEECLYEDAKKAILAYRITYASGYHIMALSSRPNNLRSRQGVVVIDEGGFVEDLGAILKSAMALTMWNGKVRVLSSHNGELSQFNQLIEDIRAGKKKYSLHETTFDQAIEQGLFKRICLVSGQPWSPEAELKWREKIWSDYGSDAEEELGCIPSGGSGSYIPRVVIESCMVLERPVVRLALQDDFAVQPEAERQGFMADWIETHLVPLTLLLDPGARHFLGEDFGRTSDLSVLAPYVETVDLSLDVPFLIELRNVPFDQQKQLVLWLLAHLPQFTRGAFDASGNGAFLAETAVQAFGAHKIEALHLNEPWYREHMPRFKAGLQGGRLRIPRHADVLRDLRAIELVRGVPRVPADKRFTGSDGKPRHADAAIALALGYYAATQEGEPAAGGTGGLPEQEGNPYHSGRRHNHGRR